MLGPAEKGAVDLFVLLTSLIAEFGLLGITYGFTYSIANRGRPLRRSTATPSWPLSPRYHRAWLGVVLVALREVLGDAIDLAQIVFVLAIAGFLAYSAGWTGMMFGVDQAPQTYHAGGVIRRDPGIGGGVAHLRLLSVEAAIGVIGTVAMGGAALRFCVARHRHRRRRWRPTALASSRAWVTA